MGCVLGCLACQVASCACTGLCSCCGKVIPTKVVGGRIPYLVMFLVVSVFAFILRNWAQNILSWVPILTDFCANEHICYGVFAVYRLCFCLAVFHLVLGLATIGVSNYGDFRVHIQDGWWGLKIILFLGLVVGSFFIPNVFFTYFGWVALGFAALFILIQLVYLVDFAHGLAETLIAKYSEDEEGNKWWRAMLAIAVVLYLLVLTGTILLYVFFGHNAADCGENIAFITINGVVILLVSILSIHPKVQEANPRMGLLQAGTISAYATYLIFSAVMSDTSNCNPWANSSSASNVGILIGSLFTIVAVCYGAFSSGSKVDEIPLGEGTSLVKHAENEEKEEKEEKEDHEEEDTGAVSKVDPSEPVSYSFSKFHIVFAMGAMYIAMLMSDWHTISGMGDDPKDVAPVIDMGTPSLWVKVVSSWVCFMLFLWTLLAPVCFPDRDFGYKSDTAWA